MTLDEAKLQLQQFLSDGLLLVIGSGLSLAEGIPGMAKLAEELQAKIPTQLTATDDISNWQLIDGLLRAGSGLEQALHRYPATEAVEQAIVSTTLNYLLPHEAAVMGNVICNGKVLRLTRLFSHLLKPPKGIPIVTPNYDRLIELAAEIAGLGVDTMFVGSTFATFDEHKSRESFLSDIQSMKNHKGTRRVYRDRISLYKPHGSFDWYRVGDNPYRIPFNLEQQRLLITPGVHKFRQGYDTPFDKHRERANAAIEQAARFMIIGYGFNDDHLETHLAARIRARVPTLVITHSLTSSAQALLSASPSAAVVHSYSDAGSTGTRIAMGGEELFIANSNLWDLDQFISEVLEP